MEVVFITFESELSSEELDETLRDRAKKFRQMDGLVQKYYLQDEESGQVGGLYMFNSEISRDAFLASDLRTAIREVCRDWRAGSGNVPPAIPAA
ncbi:hypothetical protein A4G99_19445 [Haladaptatus sp. R4]|uniref:YdhR family protein n=1 Tax=Haladaptatus sp. R4 TaxID=1679489 RepID=UPI0007B4C564|nr:YdhR family protein [Haladaptatus sp. R4]KZN22631.1 hypothetical protein A4G99_19445 [Haladaptatus sp. R4]